MPAQKEYQRQYLIIIIAVVVLVLIVVYVGWGYFGTTTTAESQFSPVSTAGKGTPTAESKKYSEDLQTYNDHNATKALEHGSTYVSSLSTSETKVKDPAADIAQPPPGERKVAVPATVTTPVGYGATPNTGNRNLSKADQASLQAMFVQWAGANANSNGYSAGITKASVEDEPTYAASLAVPSADAIARAASSRLSSSAMQDALKQQLIVVPYAQTYAVLSTEIDTDETSLVRAVVPDGMPYGGAELYATGYKRLQNDVDMTFDAMVYQGRAYKVTAKPVDMTSNRTALSGEVRHHYFARIVLPALANGIGNTAQMFATAGSQNVVTPQGGVISTTPTSPSARNIAGTFVGGAGQSAGQVLTQEAAQIPVKQTIIRKGEVIGIQFIGVVTAADDMAIAASSGKTAEASPAVAATVSLPAPSPSMPRQSAQPVLPGGLRYTPVPVSGQFQAVP